MGKGKAVGGNKNTKPTPAVKKTKASVGKKKKVRRKGESVLERCGKMIALALDQFSKGGGVTFETIRHQEKKHKTQIYEKSDHFYQDCWRIKNHIEEISQLLECIGVPVPKVTYKGGRLEIPVRGFTTLITEEQRSKLAAIAKSLVETKHRGEDLVPRVGSVYFGFGTTLLEVAKQLLENEDEFSDLWITTENIEILMHYYVAAPRALKKIMLTNGGQVDFELGSVTKKNTETPIETAIISFDSFSKNGKFFADTEDKLELIQKAIDSTTDRIILVGDSAKFGRKGKPLEIRLPQGKDKEIVLFSDKKPSNAFKRPKNMKVKLWSKTTLS